jgi:hypothetical protein
MLWFEIHMTGNESIHEMAKKFSHKTIGVELVKPDLSPYRIEHMTSIRKQYHNYYDCHKEVMEWKDYYQPIRTKIECQPDPNLIKQSIYIESHFDYDPVKQHHIPSLCFPLSKNIKKKTYLGTDRVYKQEEYLEFYLRWIQHKPIEIELCLYDNNVNEDKDWFDLYYNGEERSKYVRYLL